MKTIKKFIADVLEVAALLVVILTDEFDEEDK